jgi:hypothetical protein
MRTRDYLLIGGIVALVFVVVGAVVTVPMRAVSDAQRIKGGMTLQEVEAILGPGTPLAGNPYASAAPGTFGDADVWYRWRRESRLPGIVLRAFRIHVGFKNGRVAVACVGAED